MPPQNGKYKLEWFVTIIAALILVVTTACKLFIDKDLDIQPSYYLFTVIAGLVFGAVILRRIQ